MTPEVERRCLQVAILLAGIVPVTGGLAGILAASWLLEVDNSCGASCDSHVRYLSGLLLGIGLVAWSLVPTVERVGPPLRLLTGLVVIGGLARLSSLLEVGVPSRLMIGGLLMELVVTSALCLWQSRIARVTAPLR